MKVHVMDIQDLIDWYDEDLKDVRFERSTHNGRSQYRDEYWEYLEDNEYWNDSPLDR